jgi:hypothetical protein
VDGASLDGNYLKLSILVWDFDGSQVEALFIKHFYALVKRVHAGLIVGRLFSVKVNRGGTGRFGIGGHLQFFGGRLRELSGKKYWEGRSKDQSKNKPIAGSHDFPFVNLT